MARYAQTAKPLYQLVKKGEFEWNTSADKAFTTLKQRLKTALIVGRPDPDKKFFVRTDA